MKSFSLDLYSYKDKFISFLWQHLLLLISLFLMTFGVALCVRSSLGSSVISAIPYAFTLAGEAGKAPELTIGDYTNIMNIILVTLQILILRRKFEAVQLFQLIIGFLFGFLLDVNMQLSSIVPTDTITMQCVAQLLGCCILGIGIAFEIRCGSVTMPGEGISVAVSRAAGIKFAKAKIIVDITLVVLAVASGYIFFGRWLWNVIGPATLFAMIFVGYVVKLLDPHIGWFDRVVQYRPGIKRTIVGLARLIRGRE